MTDKQIVIDDVDVSGCINRNDFKFASYDCYLNGGCQCKDNPNCLYKQLARKTQECQQLINKNNRLEEELNTTKLLLEGKNNQYTAKTQECEELKKQLTDFMNGEYCANGCAKMQTQYKEYHCKLIEQLDQLKDAKEQAEQKLRRIREVAKQMVTECIYDDFDCKDCVRKNECTYFGKSEILQIIDEVE